MSYLNILVAREGRVGTIILNRPKVLNALNDAMMDEVAKVLSEWTDDDDIGAVILKGNDKSFAAGADIESILHADPVALYRRNFIGRNWEAIRRFPKPIIAAVSGFALGGGCEIAMMCDLIIAADNAKFGQPELKLGVPPGAGGTQCLPRTIGKYKAMDLLLTTRTLGALEAEQAGLVSRVVPLAELNAVTREIAEKIASFPLETTMTIKECVNAAFETDLTQGLRLERRVFFSAFGTTAQQEGMQAFLEKRPPNFHNTEAEKPSKQSSPS